jgi:hypothetical protein
LEGGECLSVAKILCEEFIYRSLPAKYQALVLSLLGLTSVVFDKPYFVHDDPRLSQVIRKYRSNLLALKADAPKDKNLLNREWTGINLNFPNNSSLDTIPSQIEYLGPLELTDTSRVCKKKTKKLII